jgi:hypothetical protein
MVVPPVSHYDPLFSATGGTFVSPERGGARPCWRSEKCRGAYFSLYAGYRQAEYDGSAGKSIPPPALYGSTPTELRQEHTGSEERAVLP